jgi:hypothetical protein
MPRVTTQADCSAFRTDCAPAGTRAPSVDDGNTRHWVRIDSSPTPAAIYLNEQFIGYSPLRHPIGFGSGDSQINLIAVPLFPGQAQQSQYISIPPLPKRVKFFMNNPAADTTSTNQPMDRRLPPAPTD